MHPQTPQYSSEHSRSSAKAGRTVVALRGVSKCYVRGGTRSVVLDSVSLILRPAESVFLLGPSGSGKTTLLSIIGCVLTPDIGSVEVLGRNLGSLGAGEISLLRRDHIGFVFQRMHLIRGLTAVENVCVPLTLAGWRKSTAIRRAHDLLNDVGLEGKADSDPAKLSVGQCQRVAIARALAADPSLVLADEPTSSLDAESGRTAMELLRRVTTEAGKTLVVVTHDHRILHYADRVLVVDQGNLREYSNKNEPNGSVPANSQRMLTDDHASAAKAENFATSTAVALA